MGQFSWLDCKTGKQIIDGKCKTSYVLVPEEFREQYGERIAESQYDGYGHFGGYDIYELVALWNKDHLGAEDIRCGQIVSVKMMDDFIRGKTDEQMRAVYGKDYLRRIGIDIACYDEDNERLEYPIKITYDGSAVYENCDPSPADPDQGWEMEESEDEEYKIFE